LMIFNAWGLIYAILCELIYVLHLNDVNTVLSNASYLNLTITNPMVILGVASLLYALIIALIPYIASRIVSGDVGGTLLTVAGAALTAATVATGVAGSALLGSGGGWSYRGAGGGGGEGGGTSGGGGQGPGGMPMPWTAGHNAPGHKPAFSFTHAASWYGGYAARAAYTRVKGSKDDEKQ
ncbi:MAG: hypothetical protein ACRD2G_03395, partial [Terriglobia bacterium]